MLQTPQSERRLEDIPNFERIRQLDIPGATNTHFIERANGEIIVISRIVQGLWDQETDGDFNVRVINAAAGVERNFKEKDYKQTAIRFSVRPDGHLTTRDRNDPAFSKMNAVYISARYVPKSGLKDAKTLPTPTRPEPHIPLGYEGVIGRYEEIQELSARPWVSTSGFGIMQVGELAPNLLLGEMVPDPAIFTYPDLVGKALEKLAYLFDGNPTIEQISRLSFGTSTAIGFSEAQKVMEYFYNMPIKCTPENAKQYNVGLNPGDMVEEVQLISEYADFINQQQKLYEAAARGRPNPITGKTVSRYIILGEPPGKWNDSTAGEGAGLPLPLQRLRMMQKVRNWCEKMCGPPGISDEEAKTWDGPVRRPRTFSVMEKWNTKNYHGFENLGDIQPCPVWVVQIPNDELSEVERRKVYPMWDGRMPRMSDDGLFYLLEETGLSLFDVRTRRGSPAQRGVVAPCGLGMRMIELNRPYDLVPPWQFEDEVSMNYSNVMGPDVDWGMFENLGYAYDSFDGPVQNLFPLEPANHRCQIYHPGRWLNVMKDPTLAPSVIRGHTDTSVIDEKLLLEIENPKTRDDIRKYLESQNRFRQGLNGHSEVRFERSEDGFPHVFEGSSYSAIIDPVNEDLLRSSKIVWVDEAKTEGYLILQVKAGGDVELPAVIFNQLICGSMATTLQAIVDEHCEPGDTVGMTASDLSRSWPTIDSMRDPKLVEKLRAEGKLKPRDWRETTFDEPDPTIIRTHDAVVSFSYQFFIRITRTPGGGIGAEMVKPDGTTIAMEMSELLRMMPERELAKQFVEALTQDLPKAAAQGDPKNADYYEATQRAVNLLMNLPVEDKARYAADVLLTARELITADQSLGMKNQSALLGVLRQKLASLTVDN